MKAVSTTPTAADEATLVRAIGRGDAAAFTALMRRYNRRLYRTARAILKDDAAAEDALQDAYVSAYRHFGDFRGDSAVATWLTRIVANQALQQLRKSRRQQVVVLFDDGFNADDERTEPQAATHTPEETVLRSELRQLIERRIDDLPDSYRTVFVMREVEDMTVEETAAALDIPEATVRTRLFRAKARLRASLAHELDVATQDAFGFDGERCDRIVHSVLERIYVLAAHPPD
jgi:RNA polymerase sigma-70 factor, ECF subfamily